MSKFFLGVSIQRNNSKNRYTHSERDRGYKVARYLSESWDYSKEKINFITFYLYKYFKPKWKRRKFICEECCNVFQGLVKNDRQKVKCPYCEEE